MPLNVRRFFASFLLVLFAFIFTYSQTAPPTNAPSAADVMRERVAKAKAHIAVRNYNAAIYELENLRRETSEPTVHSVINVLLMHSYLEQTDYKRAQEFLNQFYKDLKANKPNAMANYYAVAGQIVKGARNQIERYRGLGLSVADRNLPLEALVDIEKMRETLEVLVGQTKELGADKKHTINALPLLEEATNARVSLAKDDYDGNRWKQETADAREMLVNTRSTIINAVEPATPIVNQNTVAANNPPANPTPSEIVPTFQPVKTDTAPPKVETPKVETAKTETPKEEVKKEEPKKAEETPKHPETAAENANEQPKPRERLVVGGNQQKPAEPSENKTANAQTETAQTEAPKDNSPLTIGSLLEYATRRVNPVYPSIARSTRLTGVVKVEVVVDEEGRVASVENSSGPSMLKQAAVDALKKWQFKPFMRDGQPVKASGFVSFNFNL
ncbi:MAG TPA: TonB family protein [Pyrinomonadaceae bacterium]|nr:TonB family protein [Pyrinomonadaceae bacterium]